MMARPFKSALYLATATLLAIGLLAFVNNATQTKIKEAQLQWRLDNLSAVLPEGPYDANPVQSLRRHVVPELGGQHRLELYTAYRQNQPLAAVLEVIALDGYSGQIRLLLGLHVDGQVIAARVIEHRETPGLGDFIDYRRSEWITQFNGHSITFIAPDNWQPSSWQTKNDGGKFDAATGATITSRAVIQAIFRAVKWFSANKDMVFAT